MNPHPSENPYQATAQPGSPYVSYGPAAADQDTDNTGGVIPYKNPHALIGYYLGLFSIFPVLRIFLAVPAFILGIIGLRNRNRNPKIRGSVHAWIGIVLGGLMSLVWLATILLIVVSIVASKR